MSPPLAAYRTGWGQGTLTVTATVVTSVGIIAGPNGEQILVVANAPDSADNVSQLILTAGGASRAAVAPPDKHAGPVKP